MRPDVVNEPGGGLPARGSGFSSLWRPFRPGEARPAIFLFISFLLIITFQYTTKPVRQSTFINVLGAERLPYVYLFIAVISYPFLRAYGRIADRTRRDTLIFATCAITAATMVGFWWLFQFTWPLVSFAFYVWISITVVVLVSQFWSFATHVFDPRQAKRLFAFVGAGGLLGGALGGQIARLATTYVATRYALLVAAALLVAVAVLVRVNRRLPRAADESRAAGTNGLAALDQAGSGLGLLRQSRHLQWLAAITVLTVIVGQIVDLQFNWAVQRATTSLDQRTAFFGNFYTITGLVAFAFQMVFTSRILRTLGVGFSIRVLPVTVAAGTIGLIAAVTAAPELLLAAVLVLKAGENGVRYSLDQSARELLYVPIPARARLRAKAFIDVSVQRAAEAAAAVLLLPVTFGLMTPAQASSMSLALIGVWVAVTAAARKEYVDSFRAGLKKGQVVPQSLDLSDATALEVVLQSLGSGDARQVVHALHLLQRHDPRLVPAMLVHHDAPAVRRATLRVLAAADRVDALPLVERCLADADAGVRSEAVSALAALSRTDVRSLMLPHLTADDPGLVSAAIVSLANGDDEELRTQAESALRSLIASNRAVARAEAAKAIGHLKSNGYGEALTLLLEDRDAQVVRESIAAVRRRVFRHGPNPMHAPALISLLDNRRLKHEARRALVAFGETVIPALVHFMNSSDERLWVRRALPKTIAMIGGRSAVVALTASLRVATDSILIRKLIESLATVTESNADLAPHMRDIVSAVAARSAEYFRALAFLTSLGAMQSARLSGPLVVWDEERYQPSLLEQLLAESMASSLRNLFGLLALLDDRTHVRDAYRSIMSGDRALAAHAVEYLDNVLSSEVKAYVLPIIDELSLEDRLRTAQERFGIAVQSRLEVLSHFLNGCLRDRGEDASWGAAALYEVYTTRTTTLYPQIDDVRASDEADPLARETAEWVSRRLGASTGVIENA
jgi:AAA family ATP:ADP antiporter